MHQLVLSPDHNDFEEKVGRLLEEVKLIIVSPSDEGLQFISNYTADEYLSCLLKCNGDLDGALKKLNWFDGFQMYNGQNEGSIWRFTLIGTAIARLSIEEIQKLQVQLRDFESKSNGFDSHEHRMELTTSLGARMNKIAELTMSENPDIGQLALDFFAHFNSYDSDTRERFANNPNTNKGELYGAILALSDLNYSKYVLRRLEETESALQNCAEV